MKRGKLLVLQATHRTPTVRKSSIPMATHSFPVKKTVDKENSVTILVTKTESGQDINKHCRGRKDKKKKCFLQDNVAQLTLQVKE